MAELKNSKEDQKTKEAKLQQMQQQISDIETRVARLQAQKISSSTSTTSSSTAAASTNSAAEYGLGTNIDVYAYIAEDDEEMR